MSIQGFLRRTLKRGSAWEPGIVLDPPPPADGERVAPPDFVGVGAQKAGTSWWFRLLLDHPAVRGPAQGRKELHFFNRCVLEHPTAGLDRYAGWFPRRPGQIAGEFTPGYMAQPWTPALLRRAAPDAKLIAMLRDPVDRMVSGLTHEAARKRLLTPGVVADQVHRSCYDWQLDALYEHFPPERVLVLQYERCRAEPEAELARTFAFLGVEAHRPADVRSATNETSHPKVALLPEVLEALRPRLAASARRTAALVPDLDLNAWRSVR